MSQRKPKAGDCHFTSFVTMLEAEEKLLALSFTTRKGPIQCSKNIHNKLPWTKEVDFEEASEFCTSSNTKG